MQEDPLLIWGAIIAGGGSFCAWVAFWMKMGGAVAKVDETKARCDTLEKENDDLRTQIAALSGSFGMFREQVAKEYASHQTIREVEDRLTRSIEALTKSNSDGIRAVHQRLDDILKSLSRISGS